MWNNISTKKLFSFRNKLYLCHVNNYELMNYPLISEYVEAIKAAEDNFDQLKHLRPVLGEDGEPVMTSGNFAVVFKMKDEQTGKLHAVKCFLKEQEGRAEAYRQIAEELEFVSSTFLTPIKYLDKELFVDSANSEDSEFPVLLMDWVEGQTLDKYIREHIDDQYELSLLAYQFSRLAMWLMPQPFAHGDLKPDNILVKEDGTLVLVDYDGMYVPAMKGQKARELGSPDFRHPGRTEDVFDDHIDDFSLASILLSLKAIALQPSLLEEYGASDRLLFSEKDYRNLSESNALGALQPLMQDAELASLYSLYILALSQNNLSQVSFRLFNLSRPDKSQYEEENLSTEVTEEDLANAWTDEYGVMYSADRKKLLSSKGCYNLKGIDYFVKEGTQVICDEALQFNAFRRIILPNSIISIGSLAFANSIFDYCYIPDSVKFISHNNPWGGCFDIKEFVCKSPHFVIKDGILYSSDYKVAYGLIFWEPNIEIDSRTIEICANAFWSGRGVKIYINNVDLANVVKIGHHAFFSCKELVYIHIPDSVASIENGAFKSCESLTNIQIPDSVTYIGSEAFSRCKTLTSINIPDNVTSIEDGIFSSCEALTSIHIPARVTSIKEKAFAWCKSLTSINIPEDVTNIYPMAFYGCESLISIYIPENVSNIGCKSFSSCNALSTIVVNDKNKFYDSRNNCNAIIETKSDALILGCNSTIVPHSIKSIGNSAFYWCKSITSIHIPKSVSSIGVGAFEGCEALASIHIPDSVTSIGEKAFRYCESLTYVHISDSITSINKRTFNRCEALTSIVIPEGVTSISEDAFCGCNSLSKIVVNRNNKFYDSRDNCNAIVETKSDTLIIGCKSTIIPNNIKTIGKDAFCLCENLTSFQIPNSVSRIEDAAFACCESLTSIRIPKSVSSIGVQAFEGCKSLTSIIIPTGTKRFFEEMLPDLKDKLVEQDDDENLSTEVTEDDLANAWTDEFGVKYSKDRKRLLKAPKDLEKYSIRKGTKVICSEAFTDINRHEVWEPTFWGYGNNVTIKEFAGCNLISLDIPDGLLFIGESAFLGCHKLSSIYIPDSVQSIGYSAFEYCSSLTSITLPVYLKEIANRTFRLCINLSLVCMPLNVECIGRNAFIGCTKLEYIFIPNNTFGRFEKLLPEFREVLMEEVTIENHKGHRRIFCKKEIDVVNRAIIVQGQYTKLVCFYMNDGCQKYIPLCKQSPLSIGDEVDLNKAKLIEFNDEGIYYGIHVDGYDDVQKYLVEA